MVFSATVGLGSGLWCLAPLLGRVDSSHAPIGTDSEELTVPRPLVASIVKS
jgi:hypothetical protein